MPNAVVKAEPIPFDQLDLDPQLALGVRDRGFTDATPIQSAVFPIVTAGRDLIASAETGSGKTGAFLLPVINRVLRDPKPATADGAGRTDAGSAARVADRDSHSGGPDRMFPHCGTE